MSKKISLLFVSLFVLLLPLNLFARTEQLIIKKALPQRYFIQVNKIYFHSDSLFLNQRLLKRDSDYSYNQEYNYFDLSKLDFKTNDTLIISYHPAPQWLKNKYGLGLPQSKTNLKPIILQNSVFNNRPSQKQSPVKISGTKSFQVTSGGFGEAGFSQGLDLKLSGELTPGLEITGAISDRQVNPAYSISNNSLNELDRINIALRSKHFNSQIGDIAQPQKNLHRSSTFKKLSGITTRLNFKKWNLFATVARPRGVYDNQTFSGQDGRQGPYQIGPQAKINAVVPGSETVWLNGHKLDRGNGGDYQIDYTLGQITFNVKQPINSRSRIEIDYEPLENNFKKEYYHTGGGLALFDSTVVIDLAWLYEGDDQGGFVSDVYNEDDRSLLSQAGDDIDSAIRSGISLDTSGAYNLISDSLPDSVFVYVGDSQGAYKVIFSNVGYGKGAYNYLGSNRYVFTGANQGNYEPLIKIPAPNRQKYLLSKVKLKSQTIGQLDFTFRQSDYDLNLLSAFDDDNNRGEFYQLKYLKKWGDKTDSSFAGGSVYHKKYNYQARQKIGASDDNYRFFVPDIILKQADETRYEINSSIWLTDFLKVSPSLANLDYTDSFNSQIKQLSSKFKPLKQLSLFSSYGSVETEWRDTTVFKTGHSEYFKSRLEYKNSSGWKSMTALQKNVRENNYTDSLRGTRFVKVNSSINYLSHGLGFEYYTEDSLQTGWSQSLERQIYSISSEKNKGVFRYNSYLSINKVKAVSNEQSFWLSRLSLNYFPRNNKLQLSSSYQLSRETRQSRGVSYFEVSPGEGDYIFEDSLYVPDRDGNYIKVEELLSDESRVDRLERNFSMTKKWSQLKIVFHSRVEEELLDNGSRNLWWVVPVYVDESQPFFFYRRRFDGRVSLFPINNKDLIILEGLSEKEIRTVASSTQNRENNKFAITLRQTINAFDLFQMVEIFDEFRDSYYNRGTNINGLKLTLKSVIHFDFLDLNTSAAYRQTKAGGADKTDLYSFSLGGVKRFKNKGEIRTNTEIYQQERSDSFSNLLFSDYKPGRQGLTWMISIQYGFNKNMRLNLRINGRHADDRSARITARSELIAGF